MIDSRVPSIRVAARNSAEVRSAGEYVLYWMIAQRRTRWNFAFDRAADWARELGKPLLVLEALRCDYRWASDRIHRFILDGMRDNARALAGSGVGYYPYIEPEKGAGKGLLAALAGRAAVVVTDEFPCFFLPRMVEAAAGKLGVRLESVDANGLLPLGAPEREFARAFDFRRYLQKNLAPHLSEAPRRSALSGASLAPFPGLAGRIEKRWPKASEERLDGSAGLADLPIDHEVGELEIRGGYEAARRRLRGFLDEKLERYAEERNDPGADAASGLSPYLHFGHVSTHQILDGIARREDWTPERITDQTSGKRTGWWSLSAPAEAFLDELVTWRELGYLFCQRRADYAAYGSLPDWAKTTLADHAADERPSTYTLAEFEQARTHDELWNAAQNQLRAEGRIHNYLRMLWGKKILHWTRRPQTALRVMDELNNKYAIDGRNPNSYSGIFWVLGRFDRAWGPERPIFGKIRYMSSANTRRKLSVDGYIRRWSAASPA